MLEHPSSGCAGLPDVSGTRVASVVAVVPSVNPSPNHFMGPRVLVPNHNPHLMGPRV